MKVKEYAKMRGVSAQAVYQRINRLKTKTGQPLSTYIEPNTSELTGEAVELLNKLYAENQQIKQIPSKSDVDRLNEARLTIESLESKVKALTEQCEAQKKMVESIESQVEELRKDKQFLQTLVSTLSQKPRQGFFKRLFAGKSSDGE